MATLKQIIEDEKDNIPGVIETIDYFKTWFNKNLAIVISFVPGYFSMYEATLVIYEPTEKRMKENLMFGCIVKHPDLDKVNKKADIFKKRLNGDNPAIYYPFSETITEVKLPSDIINPDSYIKPLDIIKIQRGDYKHAAIYLGNGKVCQIMGTEGIFSAIFGNINYGGLFDKINYSWIFNKINSVGVRITDWRKFLGDNPGEITRYHTVIPFKRTEKIIEHIEKALVSDYGKGEYNLLFRNCEHFANVCVYGINISEQVESWLETERDEDCIFDGIFWDIKKTGKMFDDLKTTRQLTVDEELTIKELQKSVKVDEVDDEWSSLTLWSSLTQQFFDIMK